MFLYRVWDGFCRDLQQNQIYGVTAKDVLSNKRNEFIILKHDVETNPVKALRLAQIEHKYGHCGSYYVQAYLLNTPRYVRTLKKIQELGHEVSYHHDVMDSAKGNIADAIEEFDVNLKKFNDENFDAVTVCQHGNPVIKREGYTSNRDFFRDASVQLRYSGIYDIMVNYKEQINVRYKYISDAGYGWKVIFDPETNDVVPSDDKNIPIESIDEIVGMARGKTPLIISTHPHRWQPNRFVAAIRNVIFRTIRAMARVMMKIPFLRRFMEAHYHLAKKI